MAQFTFDTNDPEDVRLMTRLVTAGIIASTDAVVAADLRPAIDSLMASISDKTRSLLWAFMHQTRSGPTTMANIAAGLSWTESETKTRKMGLGRSVKKVQREHPGMPDPVVGRLDPGTQKTIYTMSDEMFLALQQWFAAEAGETTPPLEAVT